MIERDEILVLCDFLADMSNWLKYQDTNEDAQFWANSYNAEVLIKIKNLIEAELLVPESSELPTWKDLALFWKEQSEKK